MRLAYMIAPPQTSQGAWSPTRDRDAVAEKLSSPGFDFEIIDVPLDGDAAAWMGASLDEKKIAPDEPLLIYVSSEAVMGADGQVLLLTGAESSSGESSEREESEVPRTISLLALRSILMERELRTAVFVVELIHRGDGEAERCTDCLGAVRRVLVPELSGYTIVGAARGQQQAVTLRGGVSPMTALWLEAMEHKDAKNGIGSVLASLVINVMRANTDLYTDVPCFVMVAGRRDVTLYSYISASLSIAPQAPASQPRVSEPPPQSVGNPRFDADTLLAEADAKLAADDLKGAQDSYKRVLFLLGDEQSERRAEAYFKLARVRVKQKRLREAAISYRKALRIEPRHREALRELADVLRADGDYAESARVRRELLGVVDGEELRFEVLLDEALDHEKDGDLAECISALEQARQIKPDDPVLLARLAEVYERVSRLREVVDIKVALAELKVQPEQVARSLVVAAQYAQERVNDEDLALELYDKALDRDPTTPRAFDAITEALTSAKKWSAYEQALLRQAGRLGKANVKAGEADVWRELSSVRKERLQNLGGAIEALDRCVNLLPHDVEARAQLAKMLEESENRPLAILSLEIAAWHAPGRVETYHELMRMLQLEGRIDQAYNVSSVLHLLDDADLDEQMFYEQYHPETLVRPSGKLAREMWQLLYPLGYDRTVGEIIGVVAMDAIDYRLDELRAAGMLPSLAPSKRQDPKTSTVSLTRTFVWASAILDVPLPEIYIEQDVEGGIAAVPAEMPTALVGRDVLKGKSLPQLAFLVGRDITYYLPDHYVLVMFSTLPDLTRLFLASVSVVRPDLPLPDEGREEVRKLSKYLSKALDDEARAALSVSVRAFEESGGRADLISWARAVEIAATRAGLLVCGDLKVAGDILTEETNRSVGGLSGQERLHDLLPFSVSENYAKLREGFGVAVS